jgi:RNA recognition motif-containing protein
MIDEDDYKRTIYVGNLPENVTEQGLYAFFNTFGDIKSIQIPIDQIT